MKIFVFVLISLFLVSGCIGQIGISQECVDLTTTANEYCSQFTINSCENQSFKHNSTNIFPSPIQCKWDSIQSSCIQSQGCD